MGLIAKDPTLNNMPDGFAVFSGFAKGGHNATAMGFSGETADVFRFANRFRLAKSFEGIRLAEYTSDTVLGYDALFRVFLVWSAFERFMQIMDTKQRTIMPILDHYQPRKSLELIREQEFLPFLDFLMNHVNNNLKTKLLEIKNDSTDNITFWASAIRHIFAHGHLAAHSNRVSPTEVGSICRILFDFHLKVMDKEFNKMINSYKKLQDE